MGGSGARAACRPEDKGTAAQLAARGPYLHQRHVVADHGRLSNHDAARMVQKDAAPKACCWVDVDAQHLMSMSGVVA